MRAMEEQQQRHMKEVYMDSALSLASDPGNERISSLSPKSVYTQNTQTQRINEMITKAVKAKAKNNAEYYGLSERDDMEPQLDLDDASPSGGHVDKPNYIHAHDYYGSIRNIKNDYVHVKRIGN